MRTPIITTIAGLALVSAVMHEAAGATRYSAVGDFGLKANPNGPWSYLVSGSLLTVKNKSFGNVMKWLGWSNGMSEPDSAAVARNKSGATITYLTIVDPVNYLNIDPEANADVTERFTVPAAGTYTVSGDFRGNDTSQLSHPVEIDHNGTAVFSGTIATYAQLAKFKLAITAAAGDTIDFVTKTGSSWTNLSTGLKATLAGP